MLVECGYGELLSCCRRMPLGKRSRIWNDGSSSLKGITTKMSLEGDIKVNVLRVPRFELSLKKILC